MARNAKSFQRLPTNVIPFHYIIQMRPDLVGFTFSSAQEVFIEITEETDTVIFNSLEIRIHKVEYTNGTKVIPSQSITMDDNKEICVVKFPEKLPIGKTGKLTMVYAGFINDELKGFYRSKTVDLDGTVKYIAVTQFEPTYARMCFPCWDEPAFKSTFDIILIVPDNLSAISNMPVKSISVGPTHNMQNLLFDTTPVMSTYLVAIVIGDFDFIDGRTAENMRIRVYTPKGKREQGRFALNVATKVMLYYDSYFGIPYKLPKLDLVAVADCIVGAMENWGLIIFRETCLLVDPQNTSASIRQNVALFVAHELSHQWFGNLVTMKWWTDLWLKEGYASFMEFLCIDYIFPEYDVWTQFVTDIFISALELDALRSSHQIEVPVNNTSEINEIFDRISCNKGASIIRMLHSWIGDEFFRSGIKTYLNRHAYSNAETADLWNTLVISSNKPVGQVMSSWTKKQGFPLIKVSEKPCDGKIRVFNVSQERFFADGSIDKEDTQWFIPIAVSWVKDLKKNMKNVTLETRSKDIELRNVPKDSWVKFNSGTVGVFRTLYTNTLLEQFIPAIKSRTLPPLDRLGLLDDLSALSQSGHISTSQTLKLMEAFKHETNYTVWGCILNALSKIGLLVSRLEINSNYKAFGRTLLKDIYIRLGWDVKPNESHLDTMLRARIINRMVYFEDKDAIDEANRRFIDHISKRNILPADLRTAAYCAALMTGSANTFETLLNLYLATDLLEEKSRILSSLGATKDQALLKRALELSISDKVKLQETIVIIGSVQMSHKGRVLVWQFFKDNYQKFIDRYKSGLLLVKLIKTITEAFVTHCYAKEIQDFFKRHPTPTAEKNIKQSIETVKLNAAWLNRDEKVIEDFFRKFE